MKNTATLRLMMLKRLIQYFELQPAVSSAKCGNHLGSALLLVTKLATQIGKLYLTYPCRTYTFRPTFGCFFWTLSTFSRRAQLRRKCFQLTMLAWFQEQFLGVPVSAPIPWRCWDITACRTTT